MKRRVKNSQILRLVFEALSNSIALPRKRARFILPIFFLFIPAAPIDCWMAYIQNKSTLCWCNVLIIDPGEISKEEKPDWWRRCDCQQQLLDRKRKTWWESRSLFERSCFALLRSSNSDRHLH